MTRHNLCPNPACGSNATGWAGTASPARVTGLTGLPVTTGANATGSGFITTPTAVCAPGQVMTVSFYVKNNTGGTIAGGKQVFISYTRSSGGDTFPESFNTPALGVNGNVIRASFTTAAAPALATGLYLLIDNLVLDVEVTAVLLENGSTLDTYFDGNTASCTWDGTANNSTSTFNDTTTVTSDLDIRWRVANTVTSDVDTRWRVANLVTSDLDARWRVANVVTSDLSLKWRVGDVQQDGAAYDLNEVMDALAAIFQGVATGDALGGVPVRITAYADVPEEIVTPAVVLELDDLDWDLDMGGGADTFTVLASVLVQKADSVGAQRAVRAFLSRKATSGVARLKAELETDKTLGGLVSYAHMVRVRDIGQTRYNDITYIGADLVIEVMS